MERKIKLHSPMVKTLKVLEEGFVNRGKKKGKRIKRAKLYYLRDLGLEGEFRSFFYARFRGIVTWRVDTLVRSSIGTWIFLLHCSFSYTTNSSSFT